MSAWSRREFLSSILLAPVCGAARPLTGSDLSTAGCWLQVVVPFLREDSGAGIHSQIVLTAGSFAGRSGFLETAAGNEYAIQLFDFSGSPRGPDSSGLQAATTFRSLSPLRTSVVEIGSILPGKEPFWGSAVIRALPRAEALPHIGDLFSAAFVRWHKGHLFDSIHANPDPPQLVTGTFHSTMPFPPADRFAIGFTLFNPAERASSGRIRIFDTLGKERLALPYGLPSHATKIFSLPGGKLGVSPDVLLDTRGGAGIRGLEQGGNWTVENEAKSPKCFTYMFVRDRENKDHLAVEHPVFQGDYPVRAGSRPVDAQGKFRAQSLVFTPFWFADARQRGLTLESSAWLSSGRGLEETLWIQPFVTGKDGDIFWTSTRDPGLLERTGGRSEAGYVRLRSFQSLKLDARDMALEPGFSGGITLATAPEANHTLMKVQVRVKEWDSYALSHFRPGSRLARPLLKIAARDGLASDYLVSGVRVDGDGGQPGWDSLLGIYNIEFEEERTASPVLQLFGPQGLIKEARLGTLPPLAARHVWVSEAFPGAKTKPGELWTIRLVDEEAVVVVSALHVGFASKQLGIDHGSDRFSTFLDYRCA